MNQTEASVTAERITNVTPELMDSLNALFDAGMTWDESEGAKFLQDQNNGLFLAFLGQEVVGFLTAHRLQRFDKRKAEVLLYEIGVSPDFRRRGAGKALIECVKLWAKEIKADEVWVPCNRFNAAAVALYQSCGGAEDESGGAIFSFKL